MPSALREFFQVILINSLCCRYNYCPNKETEPQENNPPKAPQLRSSRGGTLTQGYLSPETLCLYMIS